MKTKFLNFLQEVKINSPDYVGVDKDMAVKDFVERIKHYEDYYEPIDEKKDKECSFIKIYNQGEKFLVNRVQGDFGFFFKKFDSK